MSKLSAPKKARPPVTFETTPGSKTFQGICHDMYKAFGGCYNNLKYLCRSEAERQALVAQLHELRGDVREWLEKARGT